MSRRSPGPGPGSGRPSLGEGPGARRRAVGSIPSAGAGEAVPRLGSYELDVLSGRWTSSPELDDILGIDAAFERSIEGWASLIHPADRDAMLAYFANEVIGRCDPFDRRYRIVRPGSGEVRLLHGRGALALDPAGRPVRMFGTIADITEQRRDLHVPGTSDLRIAAILVGSAEPVVIAEEASRRIRWANPAACALAGYTPEEMRAMRVEDLHPDEERSNVIERFGAITRGRATTSRRLPLRRRDGTIRLVDVRGSDAVVDGVPCGVGYFTDVTDLVAADEERARLEAELRRSERSLAEAQRIAHIGSWEWDVAKGTTQRSDELHRIFGVEPGTIPPANDAFLAYVHPEDRERVRGVEAAALERGDAYALDYRAIRPDGVVRTIHEEVAVVADQDGRPARVVGTVQDITEQIAAASERARLAAAVAHTSDSVVITDPSGAIEYVNPAFEQISGYGAAEVIGRNPRILKSGRQSIGFYRAMWRRLERGLSWNGRFFNRRADGELYEVEATISPIRGSSGDVTGYIGVERDVTALQAARSSLAGEFRERAQVAAALARLQPAGSAEDTALEICDELCGLQNIDVAVILRFVDGAQAVPLAVRGPDGLPVFPGAPIPSSRAAYLESRAAQGSWAEVWRPRAADGVYGRSIAALGVRAMAYAPIRNGEGLLGLVGVGTRDPAFARHLVSHLPAVGEFAATASALLSGQLEGDRRTSRLRALIAEVIERRAFHPVFQPIVEVATGRIVAFEALTRFDDGTPPDRRFAEAWAVDIGAELELATLDMAIQEARQLPQPGWLDINASPGVLTRPAEVGSVLARADRPLVVEITEHESVADYGTLRDAIRSLGEGVRTAVDDAGSGIANLGHIVELRPDFVKLDASLVRGVDADLGRQAMVVAMRHFAQAVGGSLVAEGVETGAEAEHLAALGVDFGQGYWYGRPAAAPHYGSRGRRSAV